MKRIWFGAALLFVLLVLGTLGSFFMERTQLAGAENLRQASVCASGGDWASARTRAAEAKQLWDEKQLLIAALYDHAALDRIEGLYAKLETFADERSTVSFRGTCAELATQLESLSRGHRFSFENFF